MTSMARVLQLARHANVWLEPLRLSVCILAGLLASAGFILARQAISWTAVAAVFFIAVSAMLQNDWRDRFHDVRKGRTLAYERPRAFFALLAAFWAASAGAVALVAVREPRVALGLAALAFAGIVYSETRRLPLVPIAIVSLTSAAPAILPAAGGASAGRLWPLFAATALVIFAREVMKDLDDRAIDGGYKWTLPLALGERRARQLAAGAVFGGLAAAASVSPLVWPGAVLVGVASIALVRGTDALKVRNCLDTGMALVILGLVAFG